MGNIGKEVLGQKDGKKSEMIKSPSLQMSKASVTDIAYMETWKAFEGQQLAREYQEKEY